MMQPIPKSSNTLLQAYSIYQFLSEKDRLFNFSLNLIEHITSSKRFPTYMSNGKPRIVLGFSCDSSDLLPTHILCHKTNINFNGCQRNLLGTV